MLSRSARIFIATEATDMRRSFDRLAEMTRRVMGQDPLAGHFFVFFNRPRDRVKILAWERGGFAIWYKRLETGCFKLPAAKGGVIELDVAELTLILEGIDLEGARKQPRYTPRGTCDI
jgi:transposase